MKALVICTGGGIGDVLLATPMMRALRQRYDKVVALTTPAHSDVLRANPDLTAVWTNEEELLTLCRRIAAERFDAAVVTWATMRTALLPFLGGIYTRVGQARRLYSPLFTHRVVVRSELGDRTTHWTQILLDYARALDCDIADATPIFVVDDASRAQAEALLGSLNVQEPFVLLHPTRNISANKAWPTQRLGELGKALGNRLNARVLVSGTPNDASLAQAVATQAGGISVAGKASLGAFAALAQRARCVVSMDSGPMHLAAAVGAPTVGLFLMQADEPERWAPLGPRTAIVRASYPCPPQHRKETCPDFACVRELEVERVLLALEDLLT